MKTKSNRAFMAKKKIFTVLVAGLMISAQALAVSTKDVCGQFNGMLNIGNQAYPNKSVYLLPGTADNSLTFVLPDFMYNAGKLGNIVLPNIPMDANGQLTLENATLYLDSIQERAIITVLNNLDDGAGHIYNSIVSADAATVVLSIVAPSVPQPIFVLFQGAAIRTKNYALPNGGFEGTWTNYEPQGWHSFTTAVGKQAGYVKDDYFKFVQSNDVRPGSVGSHSALVSSSILLGVKANGNCTNGQINAGSTSAAEASMNYNFSDPANTGFNTPFNGRPDSIVFWAKYMPADKNPANEVNKARMNTVITTNARYQDPEVTDYSAVKIATATINYAATANMGWQRISVPFEYTANDGEPAYILTTFTTNQVPGGGSSYSVGSVFSGVDYVDSVYVDDVELIYNKNLDAFHVGESALSFDKSIATVESNYCDSCADYIATANGKSAQTFIGFDATHKCFHVYVIADDFAQSGAYQLYRVEFTDSQTEDLGPIEQGLELIQKSENKAQKVLLNGQLFIRRGDAWFNAAGVRVK